MVIMKNRILSDYNKDQMFSFAQANDEAKKGLLIMLVEVGLCSAFWSLTSIFGMGGVLTPKLEITITSEMEVS